jgi:hypothetical protein
VTKIYVKYGLISKVSYESCTLGYTWDGMWETVSDYVPDVVMSSLETCNVNCRGPLGKERGGELGVGGEQFITNQGQVWTNIRTTSIKRGISK